MGGVINIITKKHINSTNLNLETMQNEHRYFGGHYVANLFSVIPIIKDVMLFCDSVFLESILHVLILESRMFIVATAMF